MEIENVKDKIRAMLNMTMANGCSEGEAMNAAGLVGKLLTTYNLTLSKVLLDAESCVDLVIETGRKSCHPISYCLIALADFTDTKVWKNYEYKSGEKAQKYHFFGLSTDTQMVKYLYDLIITAIDQETEYFKKSDLYRFKQAQGLHGKRMTSSFQKGMSNRISERLTEMTIERHKIERANNVTWIDPITAQVKCSDIVVVKKNKVEEEFEKIGISLKSATKTHSRYDYDSHKFGKAMGDRVNLNRPIESESNLVGLLE